MEYSVMERLQIELDELYTALGDTRINDQETRNSLLQQIQTRNLQLSRLIPCE